MISEFSRKQFSTVPPTSDFEEELSQQEADEEKHIIDLVVSIGGRELEKISLLVSRQGICKLSDETVPVGKLEKIWY